MQRKKTHDISKKIVDPDNELILWEEWVKIRTEEVIKLADNLYRPPVDLAMNLLENVRKEREWKTSLEHAQIAEKPTLRGNLWEQPLRLPQSCYCKPVYEVQRTATEMGNPPVIEHVCVPTYIQKKEKGIFGTPERVTFEHIDAEFNKYKKKREQELQKKLAEIDPFRPTECLIVRGHKPRLPPPKLPPLPDIIITDTDTYRNLTLEGVYAIKINNTVILKYIPGQDISCLEKLQKEPWHESCVTWNYYFNSPYKRAGRCKLFLQNLGTVTLRYCWKKLRRSIPFIPEDIYEQVFFFQKNEDVLSPGQSREIFFTFISDKPGIFYETWELSFCNVCFFDTLSDKICVNLYADAIEDAENIRRKFEKVQSRIENKVIINLVTSIINDMIIVATTVKPQQYPYKHLFVEAELFVMKNPVCFYHQTEVTKMKEFYFEMTRNEWDLSLETWRKAMIEKEFEDRMKYYNLLKTSHADFLKPWYEGEDLLAEKYRAMHIILKQMADKFDFKYKQLIETYSSSQFTKDFSIDVPRSSPITVSTTLAPADKQTVSNLFYIHAYDYVSTAIEMCAGVLSSLDLNRWIEFDFCRV